MIFPKIWSYPFDRKWKMIFFKKYMEKSYIVQIFWKDGLFKKMHWNMIFLVLSGKIVFFLAKRWSSFFGRKLKDDLSEEIHENMILSLCTYRCHKHDIVPLSQKKSKIIFSCKMHLRAIDIQLTPTIPCTFIETLIGVFIYCFPAKKTQET